MPEEPPVTIATFPSMAGRRFMFIVFLSTGLKRLLVPVVVGQIGDNSLQTALHPCSMKIYGAR
jgi:hypothetical protein